MIPRLFDRSISGSNASDTLMTVGKILQSSTEYAIVAADLNGLITLWNEGARRLYGYEPEEALGQTSARRFTQVTITPWRRDDGTGLRLHLSQKMAEVLGGTISFQSEFGRGSTFSLILVEG